MGIFSFLARKPLLGYPSYVKAPSCSSGLSSRSDSIDSDHGESPTRMDSPTVPRSCLKTFKYNEKAQEKIKADLSLAIDLLHDTWKPKHRVSFAQEMEQVHLVENFGNDPSLVLWSTSADYGRRYTTDLAVVRFGNATSSPKQKKGRSIGEQEYLTACSTAYHQFCLTGSVDKCLQRTMLIGIEYGYRALERFTSDQQMRRELSQRIRKSTVLLYRSLAGHRTDSLSKGSPDKTDMYLRAHIERLNFHHIRWALFLGCLDRLAARRKKHKTDDTAMLLPVSYHSLKKQNETDSISTTDGCVQSTGSTDTSMDLPTCPKFPANNDVLFGLDGLSTALC